jgi:hypothetical protein
VIRRFSSLREPLDENFLNARLRGALSYDRIAGYFSSGILDVAGEALEGVKGKIRVVCNSQLSTRDVETARAARLAMQREWVASRPESRADEARDRFTRLYEILQSGKLEVRVLPDRSFGLVHGKAGIITLEGDRKTTFLGSVNETWRAWKSNYELLWEDDSADAAQWAESEFTALWNHNLAVPLAEFVVQDIGRIARRRVIRSISQWRESPEPAAAIVESPVYRREFDSGSTRSTSSGERSRPTRLRSVRAWYWPIWLGSERLFNWASPPCSWPCTETGRSWSLYPSRCSGSGRRSFATCSGFRPRSGMVGSGSRRTGSLTRAQVRTGFAAAHAGSGSFHRA